VIIAFGILMLTELTSNTATTATFLPIGGALALSLGQNPLLIMIPIALGANCSYMLPVGTPPNAIVYGSGLVTLPQMARAGSAAAESLAGAGGGAAVVAARTGTCGPSRNDRAGCVRGVHRSEQSSARVYRTRRP
jgi:hypothetical protein